MTPRFVLLGLATLGACCPAPVQSTTTAFRGTVVGVSPEVSALQLASSPGTPLVSFTVPPNAVRSRDGGTLPVTAIRVGDELYVRGTLQSGELEAELVQRLE